MLLDKLRLASIAALAATCALANTIAIAFPTVSMGVYEERATTTCSGAVTCRLDFSVVATPLKITKVSCNLSHSLGSGIDTPGPTGVVLGTTNGAKTNFTEWQYLAPISAFEFNNNNQVLQYQLLANAQHVIKSGWPGIEFNINGTAFINMTCTISGEQATP